jgi:hypothetical protein
LLIFRGFIPKSWAKLQQKLWRVTYDFAYCEDMSEKSKEQVRQDKRAAALRDNLKKRKALKKAEAAKAADAQAKDE